MSEFACPVVRVGKIEKHPNADALSITEIDGCPVIIKTGDLREGDLGVYIPIEAVVKEQSEGGKLMPWLEYKANGTSRIKAKRLRGVFSMGLLIPANEKTLPFSWPPPVGQDLAGYLNIEKYVEPEPTNTRGQDVHAPPGFDIPVYDLENFRKYKGLFKPNEYVAITEKVHGCNARFAFIDGRLHVGSHNRWKKRPEADAPMTKNDVWWRVALADDSRPVALTPGGPKVSTLEQKLQHKDVADKLCFYGEVYGNVQDLKYGLGNGVALVMFDILDMKRRRWLDYPDFLAVCSALELDWAPCLFHGQLDEKRVFELAEGGSKLGEGACIREGVVVRPLLERQDLRHGRICFKLHGEGYLTRKGGTEGH